MKDHVKAGAKKKPTHAGKPTAKATGERASLPGERAEGEGMPPAPASTEPGAALEGEGSYTAGRRYDEGVQRSIATGDVERLAKEAAKAIAGPEGPALRKAEEAAKHGPAQHH
jgi:hypothetical protein